MENNHNVSSTVKNHREGNIKMNNVQYTDVNGLAVMINTLPGVAVNPILAKLREGTLVVRNPLKGTKANLVTVNTFVEVQKLSWDKIGVTSNGHAKIADDEVKRVLGNDYPKYEKYVTLRNEINTLLESKKASWTEQPYRRGLKPA